MYYERDALACIAAVAPTGLAAPAIAACDAAMYYDRDALTCVTAAGPLGRRAGEFITYCDQASYYDRDALTCIGQFTTGR
jgi:hypothetical protein